MKPGRELDALVAEKVMGYDHGIAGCRWCQKDITGSDPYPRRNPHFDHYSTDIKAAWEVVDKGHLYGDCIRQWPRDGEMVWQIGSPWWDLGRRDGGFLVIAEADTAAHAICLAALKAIGVEVPA